MYFLKILVVIGALLVFPSIVQADEFNNTGDNTGNRLYQSVAYTIGSLPSSEINRIVEFDTNNIIGVDTSSFRDSNSIDTVTDFNGARTIPGIGDRVSVPPESRIDLVYLYKNSAGHAIDLSYILVPLSSNLSGDLGLAEIIETQENIVETSVSMLRTGQTFVRDGKYLQIDDVSKIADGELGNMNIGSLYVKNPLKMENIHADKSEENFKIAVTVKNNTSNILENLVLRHLNYSVNFTLSGGEEKILEYMVNSTVRNAGGAIDLGNIFIENPNSITRCSVGAEENFRILGLYTVPVFSYRLDGGIVGGAFTNPNTGNYCITIIPYTMASNTIEYVDLTSGEDINNVTNMPENNPNYMFEDLLVENDLQEKGVVSGVYSEDFSLPKTFIQNTKLIIFLVVDMYLWYSYVRKRKNYENRNNNTKVCAKHG